MKISEYDGSRLRLILTGMITDPKVCSRLSDLMSKKGGPRFNQRWADLIAEWCGNYMRQYNAAPNGNIQAIFQTWAQSTASDKDTINQVETLLDYMSKEYDESTHGNSDFILNQAAHYFDTQNLRSLIEEVQDEGSIDNAYSRLSSAKKVDLGYSSVINPMRDNEAWVDTFDEERGRPLFEYPGALGQLIGQSFTKGKLFAFQGIEKVGKSFYLLDAAFRALKRRHKVAYFEVGDLGRDETIVRLGQRATHETVYTDNVDWPIDWDPTVADKPITKRRHKDGVSYVHAIRRMLKYSRGRDDLMKLSCHPNSTINVSGIEAYLQEWARSDHWIPDMVVVDYADILAPPAGVSDPNSQVDLTWKHLRRLSQNCNCLLLTATQSGAQAYRSKLTILTKRDFQGRRTKYAEVDGMLGLNATDADMQNGVTRLNWIVRRKGKWSVGKQVVVAGCLATAMPIVLSKRAEYKKIDPAAPTTKPAGGSEDKVAGNTTK